MVASLCLAACAVSKIIGFDLPQTRLATDLATVGGEKIQLFIYLIAIPVLGLCFYQRRGLAFPSTAGVGFVALILFAAASTTWSAYPQTSLLRFAQAFSVPILIVLTVDVLGWRNELTILSTVLALAVVLDYVFVALFPAAKHLTDEIDPALVGTWRGVHTHKNVAGGVLAATILIQIDLLRRRFSSGTLLLLIAAIFFLAMTASKTSIAAAGFCVAVYIILPAIYRARAAHLLASLVLICVLTACVAFISAYGDELLAWATERDRFTGRGLLWSMSLHHIWEQPLTGVGFGSFWRVGPAGPSFGFPMADGWSAMAFNGHNGYLDAAAALGLPGLFLVVTVYVVRPWRAATAALAAGVAEGRILTTLIVFLLFHNLFETSFLNGGSELWFVANVVTFCAIAAAKEVNSRPGSDRRAS